MPDEGDIANDMIEIVTDRRIAAMRQAAQSMPSGEPGECMHCNEYFTRIVHGACARCRDKYENNK